MSYCRWSSDDFQCDVYVYEDVSGGFTTHVAGTRFIFKQNPPPPIPFTTETIEAWMAREKAVRELVESADRVDIGLPHDGDSFNDGDAGACADRLESLRAMGYVVPQYAINALREEAATPTGEDA